LKPIASTAAAESVNFACSNLINRQGRHMSDSLIVSSINSVLLLTINRPEKRNALNAELVSALREALLEDRDDPSIRVAVLQGEGDAFCAGADLEYMISLGTNTPLENEADSLALMSMFSDLRSYPKPVIAKVQGPALAGGCGLALACDIVVASENATFGFPEVRIGFVPAIVMRLLVERVGAGAARELLLRGNVVDADTAMDLGMINYVTGADELDASVERLAFEIAGKTSPHAVRLTKQLFLETASMDADTAMRHAATFNALARNTDDFRTGLTAFLNKQKPSWK